MRWLAVAVLTILCSALIASRASAENLVRIKQGSGGPLDETRLYSVKYDCGHEKSLLRSFASSIYGFGMADITVNFGVEIRSKNPAAAPAADTAVVFNPNVVTYDSKLIAGSSTPKVGACPGQFFVSGTDNYLVTAKSGYNETASIGKIADDIATAAITGASALYPLLRVTKPPEFDNRVNEVKGVFDAFSRIQAMLHKSNADSIDPPKDLTVGINSVTAYNSQGARFAWMTLTVEPVVSLIKEHQTKFLAAYKATATDNALSLTGSDDDLRQRCRQAAQSYISSGIRDPSDLGYLLYRRLLTAGASPQQSVTCFDDRAIAFAALRLVEERRSPLPTSAALRISRDDIDNILPVRPDSDQPHTRARLAVEMSDFLEVLGQHLRGRIGLTGTKLTDLLDNFQPQVSIDDTTIDQKVLTLISPNDLPGPVTVDRDKLLSRFKEVGLVRWFCVQRTKRDKVGATIQIYDRKIDSAVMFVVAKAAPNEPLDFNKSTMYGIHVLFAPAKVTAPLKIKKLVFEERFRDAILKENRTICGVSNVPPS